MAISQHKTARTDDGKSGVISLGTYVSGSSIYLDCDYETYPGYNTNLGYNVTGEVQKWNGSFWEFVEKKSSWFTASSRVTLGFHNYGKYGNTLRVKVSMRRGMYAGYSMDVFNEPTRTRYMPAFKM